MGKWIGVIIAVTLLYLHQDSWNWRTADPLLFGFLPVGLSYHAGFTLASAAFLAALVKWAWPKHLE